VTLAWLAATLVCVTTAASDSPELHTIELPRFRIQATARAAPTASVLSELVEAERDDIAKRLGRDWDGTTELRVGWGDEMGALAEGIGFPGWAAGLAVPERNLVLFEARSLLREEGRRLLKHELAHVALGRLGDGVRWPRWFQEGFAMLVAGEWSLARYEAMYRATLGESAIPLYMLNRSWPDRLSEVEIAYAQSHSFVSHLYESGGPERFAALIGEVSEGLEFEAAFRKVWGHSLDHEEAPWRATLGTRYRWIPIATGTGTLWVLGTLVFLAAYARVRLRNRERLEQMELEERAREAALRILEAEQRSPLEEPKPESNDLLH